MIKSHFKPMFQKLILLVFTGLLSLSGNNAMGVVIAEKRIEVAMRMIGHEVLMKLGDCESRIMPIEKIDDHYKIPFESNFGFDPADMVSIIDHVMTENRVATDYIVEVEHCESGEVVHSFAMGTKANPSMTPCLGRALPEDCYSLVVTIWEDNASMANLEASPSDGSLITPDGNKKLNIFNSAFLIILVLSLVGFIAYFSKKRNPRLPAGQAANKDPNLISIGNFQFDKRKLALSYENKSLELSHKEAELLTLLHTSANTPLEREVILQQVWGDEGAYIGRTLDVFISKLRKKLEADTSLKIVNIRGVGYKLMTEVS